MFFKKMREKRINEMVDMIKNVLPTGVTMISFNYDLNIFENMSVEVEYLTKCHTFKTDHGAIYHNGVMVCDGSYRYFDKQDVFVKLLETIQNVFDPM